MVLLLVPFGGINEVEPLGVLNDGFVLALNPLVSINESGSEDKPLLLFS